MDASNYVISQLEILRRIAERARNKTLDPSAPYLTKGSYVDIFQHMLDEIERTKLYVTNTN